MAGLNKVILIGNLGQDPEINTTNNGKQIAKFTIATSDGMKDQDGNTKTEWHRIVAFGKTAEVIGNYVKKGSMVSVEGSISYGKYENREGATVYTTDIICSRVVLLDKKESGGNRNNQQPNYNEPKPFVTDNGFNDSSLPF